MTDLTAREFNRLLNDVLGGGVPPSGLPQEVRDALLLGAHLSALRVQSVPATDRPWASAQALPSANGQAAWESSPGASAWLTWLSRTAKKLRLGLPVSSQADDASRGNSHAREERADTASSLDGRQLRPGRHDVVLLLAMGAVILLLMLLGTSSIRLTRPVDAPGAATSPPPTAADAALHVVPPNRPVPNMIPPADRDGVTPVPPTVSAQLESAPDTPESGASATPESAASAVVDDEPSEHRNRAQSAAADSEQPTAEPYPPPPSATQASYPGPSQSPTLEPEVTRIGPPPVPTALPTEPTAVPTSPATSSPRTPRPTPTARQPPQSPGVPMTDTPEPVPSSLPPIPTPPRQPTPEPTTFSPHDALVRA